MEELNFEEIGKNIRTSRLERHYTQEYIANKIGVNVSHMQTATFRGQQGRISRPVRAILSGQF